MKNCLLYVPIRSALHTMHCIVKSPFKHNLTVFAFLLGTVSCWLVSDVLVGAGWVTRRLFLSPSRLPRPGRWAGSSGVTPCQVGLALAVVAAALALGGAVVLALYCACTRWVEGRLLLCRCRGAKVVGREESARSPWRGCDATF